MNHQIIFNSSISFPDRARHVFRFQYERNGVYRRFCDALGANPEKVATTGRFPMLPVEAFRDAECTCWPGEDHDLLFRSSGTAGMERSRHPVKDAGLYETSIRKGFDLFYDSRDFVILAYVPGYSDNPESSLVWMLDSLIARDPARHSRFLPPGEPLDENEAGRISDAGKRLMLFGAAFGLLDMAATHPVKLPRGSIIVETGGMKTHRREMNRGQMHRELSGAFGLPAGSIHSEYGMTELLSQAWMQGDGVFRCPPWMQVHIYNPENPLQMLETGREGLIGITDLANLHSCSFLMTGDQGVMHSDGSFEVHGRMQPGNLRGCNFLLEVD